MKQSGLIMYDGKAYRNKESVKEVIKLSFKQKIIILFSPNMIIHTDVFCQAEIQGGKVVTTIDNETYLFRLKQWFRKKFPKKGGVVQGESNTDGLANPPKYNMKCLGCGGDMEADNPVSAYCPTCYDKKFGV